MEILNNAAKFVNNPNKELAWISECVEATADLLVQHANQIVDIRQKTGDEVNISVGFKVTSIADRFKVITKISYSEKHTDERESLTPDSKQPDLPLDAPPKEESIDINPRIRTKPRALNAPTMELTEGDDFSSENKKPGVFLGDNCFRYKLDLTKKDHLEIMGALYEGVWYFGLNLSYGTNRFSIPLNFKGPQFETLLDAREYAKGFAVEELIRWGASIKHQERAADIAEWSLVDPEPANAD